MPRSRVPRAPIWITLCVALAVLRPATMSAQAGLANLDDATMVPRGEFRLDAVTSWLRYNSLFAAAGASGRSMPLGAAYSFDSLGVAQLPALAPTQSAIGTLTGSAFRLSLGRTEAAADARVVVTPVSLEYGLSDRVTLGLLVPFVRTRTSIILRVNPAGTEGNVGVNPASVDPLSLQQDSAVVAQLQSASATLSAEQQACQANASANANCPAILARPQDVTTLVQTAGSFATTFASVYGESSQNRGAPVVPVDNTPADLAIRGRLTAFDSSFNAFLNSGPLITAAPAGAGGVMGTSDLNTFLRNPAIAGFDSLASTVRISTGDVQLSARIRLFDGFLDSARVSRPGAVTARATFTGTVSLPTGQPASPTNPLDIATGLGTAAVGGRLAAYVQGGARVGLALEGEYTQPLGQTKSGAFPLTVGMPFPPSTSSGFSYTPGAIARAEIAPRLYINRGFAFNGTYAFLHVGADRYAYPAGASLPGTAVPVATWNGITTSPGTQQLVGFGFTYSSVPEYARGHAQLPIDVTFTHLEAVSGAAGMPRSWTDQVSIRLYFGAP